jgi:elongation factor P
MATTSDLQRGMLIRYNNALYRVIDYEHISPGNWRAFVRLRLKNFENGKIIEDRVRAGADVDIVFTQTRPAQYLYKGGETYFFMDNENYEQVELHEDVVRETMQWIRENENVDILVMESNGQILDVEAPNFVTLKVVRAEASVRGDTATNVQKKVTLETGAEVAVPAFMKEGDMIKIDTRSGSYVERVNK